MRWIELEATTPSGKTLFVCRACGRVSPAPDKQCSKKPAFPDWHPYYGLSCTEIEERLRATLLHPILMSGVGRSTVLAKKLKTEDLQSAAQHIRNDRNAIISLTADAVCKYLAHYNRFETDRSSLWDALEVVRKEVRNK